MRGDHAEEVVADRARCRPRRIVDRLDERSTRPQRARDLVEGAGKRVADPPAPPALVPEERDRRTADEHGSQQDGRPRACDHAERGRAEDGADDPQHPRRVDVERDPAAFDPRAQGRGCPDATQAFHAHGRRSAEPPTRQCGAPRPPRG